MTFLGIEGKIINTLEISITTIDEDKNKIITKSTITEGKVVTIDYLKNLELVRVTGKVKQIRQSGSDYLFDLDASTQYDSDCHPILVNNIRQVFSQDII